MNATLSSDGFRLEVTSEAAPDPAPEWQGDPTVGLGPAQRRALERLRKTPHLFVMQLGCHVSRRLQRRGLVRFKPWDSRRVVTLTPAGEKALADVAAREQLPELQPRKPDAVSV